MTEHVNETTLMKRIEMLDIQIAQHESFIKRNAYREDVLRDLRVQRAGLKMDLRDMGFPTTD